jgi:transposase
MTLYRHGHNSVAEVPFQISQNLPASPQPLMQKLGADNLRSLVVQHPAATLQDYCELVQRERGIQVRPQTMCKLLARIGMPRRVRCQLATTSAQALAA